MRLTRADRSPLGDWWWTLDKVSLLTILVLLFIGVVMSFAASPPIARDLGLANEFHFVQKHIIFLIPAIGLIIGMSMLSTRDLVRVGLIALGLSILGMLAALAFGAEIKGARRWIDLGFFQAQPSELAKPALVLVSAWLFAEHAKRPDLHINLFAILLFLLISALLVAQPDIGQTMLLTAVWGCMFFVAGMSWLWIAVLGSAAIGGLMLAYLFIPHVTSRIDRFLNPEAGDNHQTDRAIESFVEGGWFGRGPGEGVVKEHLPDSHADFLFAVMAEEFGIVMCLIVVGLYLFLFVRLIRAALSKEDVFTRYAIIGMVALLAIQSAINMGVNLQLLPAKGMTLPFLSYGISSLLSVALSAGVLLGLTRHSARGKKGYGATGQSTNNPWRWNLQRG
ncbi:MAG: putative peptidoglycan glycosyltransferase FtsW [Pseudomonadota bacterium]